MSEGSPTERLLPSGAPPTAGKKLLWEHPEFWGLLWFGACLSYSISTGAIGWGNLLTEHHAFRQTQTAITTYYMVHQPWRLAYETPVLGPPWTIPIEFPLYQGIVAAWCKAFSTPLDQTGRFVNYLFFLLTTGPLYLAVKALGVERRHRFVFLGLFIVSPFYIFWSRSFMIESTALFLAVTYLAAVLGYRSQPRAAWVVVAWASGTACALTKVTTLGAFWLGAVGVFASIARKAIQSGKSPTERYKVYLAAATALGGPVLAAWGWTAFTDAAKEQSVFGHFLTSRSLADWIHGTWTQKISWATWQVIFARAGSLFTPDATFWVGCLAVVATTRRRWKEVVAAAGLFVASPVFFTNLHYVHDYYMYANGIFLVAAVGFCVVGLYESSRTAVAGTAMLLVTCLAAVVTHWSAYAKLQSVNFDFEEAVAQQIERETAPASVLITVGFDWAPVIPYYARRKALMIPGWVSLDDRQVLAALRSVRSYEVGALVFRPSPKYQLDQIERLVAEAGLQPRHVYVHP